jgi:RNA polymerase sigma-70 factor (ECF subfamily)
MSGTMSLDTDLQLLENLRDGQESAFERLIEAHQASMIRVALLYVPTRALAEEAVQEAWIGVLKGLRRFEGRSSLKTWIFSILMNQAKTIGQREGRYQPINWEDEGDAEPSVAPERFHGADGAYPDHWTMAGWPDNWEEIPDEVLLNKETLHYIQQAIDELTESQRMVITLRDVEMLTSEEVCNILRISETNQRVLLHRARSKVRQTLETYLSEQF